MRCNVNIFSKRLKELREHKNISKYKLAKDIGVSDVCIGRWENGTREPNIYNLKTLCVYFNCSADYLSGREKE